MRMEPWNIAQFKNSYLIETNIMAKMRYFPRSGTTSDVGGMISTTSRKNTYKLVRMEMESVTWKINVCGTFVRESRNLSIKLPFLHCLKASRM